MASSNITDPCVVLPWSEPTMVHTHPVRTVTIAFYVIVGLLGVFFNFFAFTAIVLHRDLRCVSTNIFVVNLALTDLLIVMSSLWITPTTILHRGWKLGAVGCYVSSTLSTLTVLVSTFTLVAIAADRYVIVLYPFRGPASKKLIGFSLVLIWCLGASLTAPYAAHVQYSAIPSRCPPYEYAFCLDARWRPESLRLVYGTAVFLLKTLLPTSVIAYCHVRVATRISQRFESLHNLQTRRSALRRAESLHQKRRINRVLSIMVITYFICSAPLDTINLIKDIDWTQQNRIDSVLSKSSKELLNMLAHMLAMLPTISNPLLYVYCNTNICREFDCTLQLASLQHHVYQTLDVAHSAFRRVNGAISQKTSTNGSRTVSTSSLPKNRGHFNGWSRQEQGRGDEFDMEVICVNSSSMERGLVM